MEISPDRQLNLRRWSSRLQVVSLERPPSQARAEATDSTVAPEVALARVFLAAVQGTGVLPCEVRIRSQRHKASLAALMESFGVKIRIMKRLPAADQACKHLLRFLGDGQ